MKIQTLRECTREHLTNVLEKTGWDLDKTALLLQVPLVRVRQIIAELGIEPRGNRTSASPHPEEKTKEVHDETPES